MRHFRFKYFCRKRDKICIVEKKYLFIDELAFNGPIKRRRDLECLAKLRVEAISPFALDDLLYGFFANESRLVIFIACKNRLEQILPRQPSCIILPEILPNLIVGHDFALVRTRVGTDDTVTFHGTADDLKLKLSDPIIFNADLRQFSVKFRTKNLRKISTFLDYGICLNLVLVPLLCAFSIFLLFQGARLNSLEKQISERRTEVATITSKHAFLEHVSKFYSDENFCLEALEIVNQVRPDDILFVDANADFNGKMLKIKGTAPSVGSVTRYCDALKHCESIEILKPPHIYSRDRTAFFTVDIYFR
jgi:large-conductance mechanosensitive channel